MNISKELQEEIERRRASHIKYELCSDEDIALEIEEEKNKRKETEKTSAKVEILEALFDRQVDTLVKRGYPEVVRRASDRKDGKFLSYIVPLRQVLKRIAPLFKEETISDRGSNIPLLIVVQKQLVSIDDQMERIQWRGQSGTDIIGADKLRTPKAIRGYPSCYLLCDVRIGGFPGSEPIFDVLKEMEKQGRLALTIEEGIALATHYPRILKKGALLLPASRFSSYQLSYIPSLDCAYGRPRLAKVNKIDEINEYSRIPSAAKRMFAESDKERRGG